MNSPEFGANPVALKKAFRGGAANNAAHEPDPA